MNKSMLASKNLPTPIRKDEDCRQWIPVLCTELAVRLNEARDSGTSVWPKTISLHTRQAGDRHSRSKQSPFPYVRDLTGDIIATAALKLWKELHGTDTQRSAIPDNVAMKIINISVSFHGIEAVESGQKGIGDFLRPGQATIVSNPTNDKTPIKLAADTAEISYQCPKCSTTLKPDILDGEDEQARLELLKAEHEDWHFAQQIAKEQTVMLGGTSRRKESISGGPPSKKRKKDEGIAKYFSKKW